MQFAQIDFQGTCAKEQKICARAFFKSLRAKYTQKDKARDDREICERLIAFVREWGADTVLMFYPIKNEPDILPAFDSLVSSGIKVGFPVSLKDTCELKFLAVNSLESMTVGEYGIPEPPSHADELTQLSHAVCICPALAYDIHGTRLGYGKGYYDRFLADFDGIAIGVACSHFVIDTLPRDELDVPISAIITQKEVIFTK